MKAIFAIDDQIVTQLQCEAARRGCTMSELTELALRRFLEATSDPAILPKLPSFDSGGALIDVADRGALQRVFDAMADRPGKS
jgi:hypothetical protein